MFVGRALYRAGGKPGFGPAAELLFFASLKESKQRNAVFGWLGLLRTGGKPGFGPAAELLFFASPKKSNQKKGEPRPCPSGSLRYSQRSGHLQTRFAQTMQVPSSERCSVAQHGLMAGGTPRLVRFADLARMACSLRSPRGVGLPHSSTLTSLKGTARRATTPAPLVPHASLLITGNHKGCPYTLIPHPSLLTPHPSPLTPHSSPLTPHPSPLTPHSYDLTPHSSQQV